MSRMLRWPLWTRPNVTADIGSRPAWVIGGAIACVLLGVGLRFVNLDARSYTNDEASTSIRSAGASLYEWSQLFDSRTRTVAELRQYQTLLPGRTSIDTVRILAVEDPQHPPLYYLLDRWWITIVGDSIADRRALSAIMGTLAIGAAFFLGAEVAGSLVAGLVFAALIALSPFQILYSQQAREYSLWGLTVLAATWLLVRALRVGKVGAWVWYALTVVLGMYTDLLFPIVLVGHAGLVLLMAARPWLAVRMWVSAVLVALVAFAPWLLAVVHGAGLLTNNSFLSASLPLSVFAAKWVFNVSTVFVDVEYRHPIALVVLPFVAAICLFAIVVAVRRQARSAIVAAALIVPTCVVMVVLDVLHHESRSTASRYLVPAWMGLELLVAAGIAAVACSATRTMQIIGTLSFFFLAAAGAVSGIAESSADWSWPDTSVAPIRPVAKIINEAPSATLVFKADPTRWDFNVAILVNVLRNDVRVRLVSPTSALHFAATSDTTFLLDPNQATRDEVLRSGNLLQESYLEGEVSVSGITGLFRKQARAARNDSGISDDRISLWKVLIRKPAPE